MRKRPSGGATRCAQLLNMHHDLPTESNPEDPATIINTGIKAAFQEMCRQTSIDTLTGKATKSHDGGQLQTGDEIPTIQERGGWRIHCGVEVTELSTNKQHTLSLWPFLG